MAIRVAVNGYGTIGKRVADAVLKQKDMELTGVTKTRPTFEARIAVEKGYRLYVAGEGNRDDFKKEGIEVTGTLADLLEAAEVVIDCTPDNIGVANQDRYEKAGVKVIWQGGEKASIAEHSFNAMANFRECLGANRLRVLSCNTTGIARASALLMENYGVENWDTTIVRRAADPGESKKGPINGILPTLSLPSHHGPDVQTVLPKLRITTSAVVVPTTLMHVHFNHVTLSKAPAERSVLLELLRKTPRFVLFPGSAGVEGTPQVMEWARDRGLPRSDVMENVLWEGGIRLVGRELFFFQGIHQESIVVPENIDAVRAMFRLVEDGRRSMELTNAALGISKGSADKRATAGRTSLS